MSNGVSCVIGKEICDQVQAELAEKGGLQVETDAGREILGKII